MNIGLKGALRILLVEDNAADIYLLRLALAKAGLTVELTVIEDGAEALAFVRRQGKYAATPIPDLAVLDLNLPKAGGAAVLEAMRQNPDMSHVPVAIMSSSAGPRDQTKDTELGIRRYITKPPGLEEFMHIGQVLKEILLESTAALAPPGSTSVPGEKRVITLENIIANQSHNR
jgi:two-component system, chemotaxis family, response regulator Rcp1